MQKQKVSIIGDGLAGLTTALILSKLDIQIHLISKNINKIKFSDNRATAISPSNYLFLMKHLNSSATKEFWPCNEINLYQEKLNRYYRFMNFSKNKKKLMYIFHNTKLKKLILKNINKKNNIKIIKKNVKNIDSSTSSVFFKKTKIKYDLIILCLGKNSQLISDLSSKRFIEDESGEIALTSFVKHNLVISDPKQYFLKEGPLAILPVNKKKFSFVWSVDKSFKNYNVNELRNLVILKLKNILDKNIKISLGEILSFPISFKINTNFTKNNLLVLGDSSYNIHPVAGQGFNLIFRDIIELYEKIRSQISLGLHINDKLLLEKFLNSRKPENLLFGLGINFTNKFFKNNEFTQPFKDFLLRDINKYKFLKDISIKISDKGILN
tara:strand:+ start:527 stop:1672 length:1146 start_codon:yes stop_codon:yes gene_type:complete